MSFIIGSFNYSYSYSQKIENMYKYTLTYNDKHGFPIVVYANSRQAAVMIAWRKLKYLFERDFTFEDVRNSICKTEKIQLTCYE